MHRAGAAAAAGPVHVEEDDRVPFANRRAVDAGQRTSRGVDDARRNMARNDWIGHTRETPVPEMHVRAADFG